jgi:hypothetical protein
MHPDIEKALRILTQYASKAQAEKSFGHMLRKPGAEDDEHVHADLEGKIPGTTEITPSESPEAGLDEDAKNVMLAHDANHTQELLADDFGDEPVGEPAEDEEQEGESPVHSLGIMSTHERAASKPLPMPPEKRGRGRPRKVR